MAVAGSRVTLASHRPARTDETVAAICPSTNTSIVGNPASRPPALGCFRNSPFSTSSSVSSVGGRWITAISLIHAESTANSSKYSPV